MREEVEGRESSELLGILGADNRQLYWSFLSNETFKVTTPRLFHLTSISGQFQSMELASPYLNKEVTTPLPFVQADLYSASQPALFLLDTGTCLWLWQGWKDDSLETDRGSGNHRFQAERRAAMSTALDYWAHKYGTSGTIRAYLIWAGLEPLVFTNQFPFWTDRDDVAEINMKVSPKRNLTILTFYYFYYFYYLLIVQLEFCSCFRMARNQEKLFRLRKSWKA